MFLELTSNTQRMNKRELIARVQRHMGAGATRDAARAAVNAVLSSILQAAAESPKAHLPHLGTFEYRPHHQRSGKGLPGLHANHTNAPNATTQRLTFRPALRLQKHVLTQTAETNGERQNKK